MDKIRGSDKKRGWNADEVNPVDMVDEILYGCESAKSHFELGLAGPGGAKSIAKSPLHVLNAHCKSLLRTAWKFPQRGNQY